MFMQLEPEEGGDSYRINTAFPASRNYLEKQQKKGMKLLWGGSEPAPAAAGQQPPYAGAPASESGQGAPIARGQSSGATVAQQPDAGDAPDVRRSLAGQNARACLLPPESPPQRPPRRRGRHTYSRRAVHRSCGRYASGKGNNRERDRA